MPTTFTSLLGLSLPATGELSGTWGDTVNNGITSLLDNAIAGTTTLSTDANVTLTTTTGAANQARQAILLCTGARTAQRTITAPAQSKTYTLINATTGGFAVQLVGAGPTTGITVVSGERALVAWNGSDFVKIASNLVTGTATRIPFFDASGLLSSAADFVRDASGNVGIGTANPGSYGRLAVVGTGDVGNFESSTGAVGITLYENGSGRARIRTLNGSAGMAFLVNLTEAMRIDSSGNVGIGRVASGGLRLDVAGGGRVAELILENAGSAGTLGTSPGLYSPASGQLAISTNAAERMRITSTGNVVAGGSVALATTATDGFLYVPTCAGTPTGTPTAITGMAPIVVNTTNNKLFFYSGGAWRDAGP